MHYPQQIQKGGPLSFRSTSFIFIISLLIGSSAYCQSMSAGPSVTRKNLNILGRGNFFVNLHRGLNLNQEPEIAVELEENRKGRDTKTIVLYGRDITGDDCPDIWFYLKTSWQPIYGRDLNGDKIVDFSIKWKTSELVMIERPSKRLDGWDVIPDILMFDLHVHKRPFSQLVLNGIFSTVFFTKVAHDSFMSKLMFEQMNVMDLEARAERLRKAGADSRVLSVYYETILRHWDEILANISSEAYKESLLGILDLGVLKYGGSVFKWVGSKTGQVAPTAHAISRYVSESFSPTVAKSVSWLSKKDMSRSIMGLYNSFRRGIVRKATTRIAALNVKFKNILSPVMKPTGAIAAKAVAWSAAQETHIAIRSISARNMLEKFAWKSASALFKTSKAVGANLPYVLPTAGIQVAAELLARQKEIFYAPPAVVEEQYMQMGQNVSYMTLDSMTQATVISMMSDEVKRTTICGVFSFVNSLGFNLAMQGEPNPYRQSLDTHWEIGGALQTQMDIQSIRYFDEMAFRSGNPKLKLVGYAFAFVSQMAGYAGYSVASKKVEALSEEPRLAIIPLLSADPQALEKNNIMGMYSYSK